MNCQEAKGLFSDYVDRRLPSPQVVSVREHVKVCSDCRPELDELRATIGLIGSLDEIETWPDFLVQVNKKIDREGVLGRLRRRLFEPFRIKLPLEAAALFLVTTFGLYLYHRMPELSQKQVARYQADALVAKEREPQPDAANLTPEPRSSQSAPAPEAQTQKKEEKRENAPRTAALMDKPVQRSAEAFSRDAPQRSDSLPAKRALMPPPAALQAGPKILMEPESGQAEAEPAQPPDVSVSAAASFASRPEIVEISSIDVEGSLRNLKVVLGWLGGKIVKESGSQELAVLAVELPRSRESEYRSVVSREGARQSSSAAVAPTPVDEREQSRTGGAIPTSLSRQRRAKTSVVEEEDPSVRIEFHISPKK